MADHWIVVEMPLYDPAVLDRNFALQGSSQAVDRPAFHLGLDGVGIDNPARIDAAPHFVNPDRAIRDGNFRDLADDAAEGFHDGDTARPSGRKRLAPAGFFGNLVEHGAMTRRFAEQVAAELPKNRSYQDRLVARKAEIGNFATHAESPQGQNQR